MRLDPGVMQSMMARIAALRGQRPGGFGGGGYPGARPRPNMGPGPMQQMPQQAPGGMPQTGAFQPMQGAMMNAMAQKPGMAPAPRPNPFAGLNMNPAAGQ